MSDDSLHGKVINIVSYIYRFPMHLSGSEQLYHKQGTQTTSTSINKYQHYMIRLDVICTDMHYSL